MASILLGNCVSATLSYSVERPPLATSLRQNGSLYWQMPIPATDCEQKSNRNCWGALYLCALSSLETLPLLGHPYHLARPSKPCLFVRVESICGRELREHTNQRNGLLQPFSLHGILGAKTLRVHTWRSGKSPLELEA
ncbi:hypothetical protein CC79DRAFT_663943 [Sarocladium strictum]